MPPRRAAPAERAFGGVTVNGVSTDDVRPCEKSSFPSAERAVHEVVWRDSLAATGRWDSARGMGVWRVGQTTVVYRHSADQWSAANRQGIHPCGNWHLTSRHDPEKFGGVEGVDFVRVPGFATNNERMAWLDERWKQ